MTKQDVRQRIFDVGIIPVIRASSSAQAVAAADAIAKGGISIVEVTMTVPGAVDVIRELVKSMDSDIVIGAGTVIDAESARRCIDAGAQFLVSPIFDVPTIKLANKEDILILAAGLTPTEIFTAWKAGSDLVKVFPCGNVGGPAYIKALKAPLPQIPLVPTGGVSLETAAAFLRAGASALGVGGELVSGDVNQMTRKAQEFIAIIRDARQPALA